ncbi:membrane transporter [Mucor ambiguus]|uniref:Membrane transporter n=1 Tax=Mucor ambiguus TaxID=91626 RepID=A0A0C9MKG4_9FUNG|nr:membrane transporter [Mucor ambiguus]
MSLTIDHALFASALQISLDPSSSVPAQSKPADQKPAYPSSQIIDNEKSVFPDSHQTSELRVKGVRFIVLFSGMLMGFFMAALDTTITITALGAIASEFNAADQIGWIGSAYLLTLSGFQPIYCSTADIIGQKYSYLVSITLFILGSVLCGSSSTMNMLIISRVIICDLMDSRTRAVYQGILGAALGLATIVGPLLGGFLADQHQWRYTIFFAIILLLCDLPLTRKQTERQRNEKTLWRQFRQVDYASFFLLTPGAVCLLIGLQIGGDQLRFDTPLIIALLILGPALMSLFVVSEIWIIKHNPIFPRHFVMSINNMAVLIGQFAGGAVNNAIIYFIPLHFQIVKGDTAVESALQLLSFFITAVMGGLLSGIVIHKTGRYRFMLWSSTALSTVGAALLQSCTIDTPDAVQYAYLAILGFGIGIFKNVFVVVGQAAVPVEDLTIATAHGQFARLLGGAFGVNLAAVIFKFYSNSSLADAAKEWHYQVSLKNLDLLKTMPDTIRRNVRIVCLDALNKIYLMVAVAAGITFLSTLFVKKYNVSNKLNNVESQKANQPPPLQ